MRKTRLCLIILSVLLISCSGKHQTYKIGVSQCSEGRWRDKVNAEMLASQHLYEQDVKVCIANSYDDTQLQIHQIDSLAETDIDLLVVAPNEAAPVTDAIKRVRQKGIPVIFFDRKAATDDYTAFIGGDNVEAGRTIGRYTLELAQGLSGQSRKPVVLEIKATMSTTPAQERHKGFAEIMQDHKELEYHSTEGDWTSDKAYKIIREKIDSGNVPDIVFCHNDGMATGVYKAVVETKTENRIKILGIDGMPGEGLEYVQFGHQVGTYIYPTHGDEIIRLALNILTNQPFKRNNSLEGILVTSKNVDLLARTSNELMNQNKDLVVIQDKLESYFGLYNLQNKIIAAGALAILLLIVALLLIWRAVIKSRKTNKRILAMNDEQTAFYTNARHQLRTPLTLIAGPAKQLINSKSLKGEQQELMEIIGRNISQLETVISSVLNFKTGISSQQTIDDDTAKESLHQASYNDALQASRLAKMKQEDNEELSSILIVDDNTDMRRYLRALLSDKFYIMESTDGQGGLKLARECVPDIVVSDVMMPIMDGLQFCKKLKEDAITSHIPVILLTARSTESQQMEGYEHGADAYLTKPFSADLLITRIYNLLKSRQQLRHLADGQQEEGQPKLSTQDKLFADELRAVFQKNLSNPDIKMDELGDELGMSRVQLYRKVKVLTGTSPVELLREMRLQRGYNLILSTTKSISEIAYEVGFNTPSYFSNCFKKQFGKYPTDLRAE